jgi:ABC-2 type transport system permease protein
MVEILYVLWLRQLKRYFRSRSRIIGSLGQPVLYLFALGYGMGAVFARAGNGNYIQFLVPGVISQSILFTSIFAGIEIIWDKQFGFLKETLVAPVSRFEIVLGRTLGGATVATMQGMIVFCLSLFFGFHPGNLLLLPFVILFMFLIALLFTGIGTAIAAMVNDMQGFQLLMNFLILPLYFLSGALFPLQGAPFLLGLIARIDPLAYGVDGLRGLLGVGAHFGLGIDILVLASLASIILAFSSYLFSKMQV